MNCWDEGQWTKYGGNESGWTVAHNCWHLYCRHSALDKSRANTVNCNWTLTGHLTQLRRRQEAGVNSSTARLCVFFQILLFQIVLFQISRTLYSDRKRESSQSHTSVTLHSGILFARNSFWMEPAILTELIFSFFLSVQLCTVSNIFSYSILWPAANPWTGADSRMPLADLRAPPVYCACNKQSLVRIFQIMYPRFVSRSRPGSAH